ncbi:MAG: hypothetical protein EAY76_06910, partial [Alphaproteobacteria bacterium]
IVEQLGAKITCGGEIEFWAVVDPHKMPSLDELKQQINYDHPNILAIVNRLFDTGITEHDIAARQTPMMNDAARYASRKRTIEELVDRECGIYFMNKRNQTTLYACCALAISVYETAESEGIKLNPDFHLENGTIFAKKDYGPIEQNDWLGQKLEITTAIASPTETALWLDRTRDIIKEKSQQFGLIADFRDKPSYTITSHYPNKAKIPGAGMHIHYGLTSADGSTNLMCTRNAAHHWNVSKIYEACADGVTEVLRQGGFALACPSERSYERFKHGVYVNDMIDAGSTRKHAIRQVGEEEAMHQEVRTPGANTPASYAVLIATLGIVEGLADMLGLETSPPPIPPWRAHLQKDHSDTGIFDDLRNQIDDTHRQTLLTLSGVRGISVIHSKGNRPATLDDAKKQAQNGSILSTYCPAVLQEINELRGGQLR